MTELHEERLEDELPLEVQPSGLWRNGPQCRCRACRFDGGGLGWDEYDGSGH